MKKLNLFIWITFLCLPTWQLMAQQADPLRSKDKSQTAPAPVQSPHKQVVRGAGNPQSPHAGVAYQSIGYQGHASSATHQPDDLLFASETGLPIHFQSKTGAENLPADRAGVEQQALSLLTEWSSLLRVTHPAEEFVPTSVQTDELNITHVRMEQAYEGIPVYGAEVILHFSPDGSTRFTGRYQASPQSPNLTPAHTAEQALQTAIQDVSTRTTYVDLSEEHKAMLDYMAPPTELVLYKPEGTVFSQHLVWHITLRPNFVQRWEYFVDAHTGAIIHQYDHTCSIGHIQINATDLNGVSRSINVFEPSSGPFYMLDVNKGMYANNPASGTVPADGDGWILTADMNNTGLNNPQYNEVTSTNNTWSPNEVSAHYNSAVSYDYYESVHGRSSINGQGGDIIAFINVAEDNGGDMDNAFWNGQFMFYGNGDQAFTSPLARSLDVGGHEMTHGVISNTANLEYQGQSGALNESFADIFAVAIEFSDEGDNNDWGLGEDIVNTSIFSSGFLRSLQDPHNGKPAGSNPLSTNGYQPRDMSEIFTGSQDNGGVHINSGIPNYAYYLFASNSSVSRSEAESTYYRAMTQYLTRSSQFIDCRLAVVAAATDLYGANSPEVNAAKAAFDQVGILNGNATNTQGDIQTNPGTPLLVFTDQVSTDPTQLYITDPGATVFQPLSNTEHRNKISVTDDGTKGFFVGMDGFMRVINMDPNNPSEQILYQGLGDIWDNVAVSKDGNRLAAVTQFIDTSIYIFDYSQDPSPFTQYILYNPTTAQGGVTSGGVLFADAVEWDYGGEYLMYDAQNQILPGPGSSDTLSYWDVGFLRAWNFSSDDFGDGNISKLFSSLPAGINVAEAVFAKNSPFIIAFDVIDQNENQIDVRAANIETGDVGVLSADNGVLGIPTFFGDDSKVLITEMINGTSSISEISLQADKINASSTPAELIAGATWPVYYSFGVRNLPTGIEASLELAEGSISLWPNPTMDRVSLDIDLQEITNLQVELYNVMGQHLSTLATDQQVPAGTQQLSFSLADQAPGLYFLRLNLNGKTASLKVEKK